VGDRTYYEATGPINPRFRDVRARPDSWEDYFAFEVFFARGGNAYDQWIINPNNSFVFHFEDRCRRTGRSDLPSSRYRVKIEGDRVSIIFWCHNSDTPRNIVFNYNEPTPSTPEKLSWVTTDLGQDHDPWWHHQPAEWTDP
jgi:hypothetical protein